jgi:hypothetical protein
MRTRTKNVALSLAAVVVAIGGTALAQEGLRPKKADRFKIAPETQQKFEALEKAGPLEPADKPRVEWSTEALALKGRVESYVDGRVLISVPVDKGEQANLLYAQKVDNAADVGDNVLFADRLYVSYPVLASGPTNLEQNLGREVELELKRDDHDVAWVSFARFP